ncbi:MAG: hypothetical protein ACE5ED_07765 [Rhodothalassiaceae bacterium]
MSGRENTNGALRALVMTLSVSILVGVAALAIVDGLEWATLSLMGIGLVPTEIVMAVTALPVLYMLTRFARRVWRIERGLESGEDLGRA